MSEWITIAALDDLPQGRGMKVDVGDHRIALFRIEDKVYAIGDTCSHAEASLAEGEVFGVEVECPRHGAVFDLASGEARTLPATAPVPSYQTKVEDGILLLLLPEDAL